MMAIASVRSWRSVISFLAVLSLNLPQMWSSVKRNRSRVKRAAPSAKVRFRPSDESCGDGQHMARTDRFRQQHNEILKCANQLSGMLSEVQLGKDANPVRVL